MKFTKIVFLINYLCTFKVLSTSFLMSGPCGTALSLLNGGLCAWATLRDAASTSIVSLVEVSAESAVFREETKVCYSTSLYSLSCFNTPKVYFTPDFSFKFLFLATVYTICQEIWLIRVIYDDKSKWNEDGICKEFT